MSLIRTLRPLAALLTPSIASYHHFRGLVMSAPAVPQTDRPGSSTASSKTDGSPSFPLRTYIPKHASWPYTHSDFQRMDEYPDTQFYTHSRLVTHIDDHAIDTLGEYYSRVLPKGGRVLDICSSWISHLPPDLESLATATASGSKSEGGKSESPRLEVIGMGMNEVELDRNPVLSQRIVQDLNVDPDLPRSITPSSIDAATCVVSIDYLTRPLEVLQSLRAALVPGGTVHLVLSNRCFPTKAIGRWLRLKEEERLEMVGDYLHFAGYEGVEIVTLCERGERYDPLWVVRGTAQA